MKFFNIISNSCKDAYSSMLAPIPTPQPKGTRVSKPIPTAAAFAQDHICLCIDVSGSMADRDFKPSRLEAVKLAACEFVNRIEALDSSTLISIIAFGNTANLFYPANPVGSYKNKIIACIQNLRIRGGTNLCSPLHQSIKEFERTNTKSMRVILLTDGCHIALGSPVSVATEVKEQGVQLDIIGIGRNGGCDEATLRRMASYKDGKLRYWFITSTEGLFEQFQSLAGATSKSP